MSQEQNELTRLGIQYHSDKAYYHAYTDFYYKHLKHLQYKPLNILELGINQGASLKMLRDFFVNSTIYGIDIDESSVKDYGDRIHTFLCSQDDEVLINKLFGDLEFDIIIDDGSHMTKHQLVSLGILFEKVKGGGVYICEDIHTSFRPAFINSETLPARIFNDYNITKNLDINEISQDKSIYINRNINDIIMYKRERNAYKCYNCCNINNYIHESCLYCKCDLSPKDLSLTCIISKII